MSESSSRLMQSVIVFYYTKTQVTEIRYTKKSKKVKRVEKWKRKDDQVPDRADSFKRWIRRLSPPNQPGNQTNQHEEQNEQGDFNGAARIMASHCASVAVCQSLECFRTIIVGEQPDGG